MSNPIALVTGASRGIGRACAVHLAAAGFDVVVSARTVHTGEVRDHSPSVQKADLRPLPGSLEETAAAVEAAGARSMVLAMDLLDRASVYAGADRVLERWGRVDLLVNNGRYVGPGQMDAVIDTPIEMYDRFLEAQTMAPLILAKLVLPGMLERGHGMIMTITSGAATRDVPAPPGHGGWGLGYAMSKAAGIKLATQLQVELGDRGIRAFNVNPGLVVTDRNRLDWEEYGIDGRAAVPPDAIGAVIAWLATADEAGSLTAPHLVQAQALGAERGLHPALMAR